MNKNIGKLIIGGAQIGLDYGINNIQGGFNSLEVLNLLVFAESMGINYIDTARDYGDSENKIGDALKKVPESTIKVITKFNISKYISDKTCASEIENMIEMELFRSLSSLGISKIEVLMLHRASDIDVFEHIILNKLIALKEEGLVGHLGVSVQSPEEMVFALNYESIEFIQMPYNILDNRWDVSVDKLMEVKKTRKVNIHVRSVYLQGLLLSSSRSHFARANIKCHLEINSFLNNTTKALNRQSVADLCLAYVRSLPWIDAIVIGVDSIKQLENNVHLFSNDTITQDQINEILGTRPVLTSNSLDPSKWNLL